MGGKHSFKNFGGKEKLFSSTNQPTREAMQAGRERKQKEKRIVEALFQVMFDKNEDPTYNFDDFIQSILDNAKKGNAKAIDIIVNSIDGIQPKTVDPDEQQPQKLDAEQLQLLLNKINGQ